MATRDWVATEIGVRLATQLTDAGMTAEDESGNLKEPIDDALRLMETAEDTIATAEPIDATGFLMMVRYTTLRVILERISDRMDVSIEGDSYRLNQVVKNVEALLSRAEADVTGWFGSSPAELGQGMWTLDLNFLGGGAERELIG